MSTVESGNVEMISEFGDLNDEERELERIYLNACLMAENAMEEIEKQTQAKRTEDDRKNESLLESSKDERQKDASTNEDKAEIPGCKSQDDVPKNENVKLEIPSPKTPDDLSKNESVKMEFSCSSEEIIEPNMDYTLDDVVEICSIPSDDDGTEDVVTNILKEQNTSYDRNDDKGSLMDDCDAEDDDEKLFTLFNDHTYTSPEVTTGQTQPQPKNSSQNLRQNIINHIVKKRSLEVNTSGTVMRDDDASCGSGNESDIEESAIEDIKNFVDQVLEGKIEGFVGKPYSRTDGSKSDHIRVKTEPTTNTENIHTEDFVQNVINAVADEDAAEYAAEKDISNSKETELVIEETPEQRSFLTHENTEMENVGDQNDDRTETCSFHSDSENDCEQEAQEEKSNNEKPTTKPHEDEEACIRMETSDFEDCQQSPNNIADMNCASSSNGKDDGGLLESISTLPDFCSEPMETTSLEERFESFEGFEEMYAPLGKCNENLDSAKQRNEEDSVKSCSEQSQVDRNQAERNGVPKSQLEENEEANNEVGKPREENSCDKNDAGHIKKTACIAQLENDVQDDVLSNKNITEAEGGGNSQLEESLKSKESTEVEQKIIGESESSSSEEVESSLGNIFDRAMEEVECSISTSTLFKELNAFVTEMHSDCEKFSVATFNIDSRLRGYIADKLEIMRAMVKRLGSPITNTVDQASQTEPKLSRSELRKLNKKNKKAMLASTDSSCAESDDNFASSSDEMEVPRKKLSVITRRNSQDGNIEAGNIKDSNIEATNLKADETESAVIDEVVAGPAIDSVYDDGVCLGKYLRSVVFVASSTEEGDDKTSSPERSRLSSISSMPGNEATASQEQPDKDKSSSNQKKKKLEEIDESDKEINRLINLDGLMRRHTNSASTKQADVDKPKPKSQNSKNKTDGILEFLESDLTKESFSSEESAKEAEEEDVISEKKYLVHYNQDLKSQLLHDSSNDSLPNEEDEEDDEFEPANSEESESGIKSPLVDKFLKTYNLEDSDDGEGDIEMATKEPTAADKVEVKINVDETKKHHKETTAEAEANKKNNEEPKDAVKGSEDSDCELLNDSFIYRKRSQTKSLEKILDEAEKRKKIQKLDEDLISLSSESDGSDVEAVEIEPAGATKSRAIKAMLRPDQLQRETVKAQKSEVERIRRLEKRQTMLSKVLAEHKELNTEEELVLDYNEETKTFIKVHAGLVKNLKPHQRDGVRFMYDSCYGGVEVSKKNHGSGCILAHCMGLGKTLQLIALMHTVISYKELKTQKILVLCPKSTVMNWGDEIARWLFPLRTKNLKVYTFNDTSDINEKLSIMREWSQSSHQKAGCLLIGYEAFRTLVFYHKYRNRNNLDTTRLEKIRNLIDEYLLQPGADLVVCDEGHIIKNSKSAISLAVAEIKTQKRIVLTGTPIQNNLKEYYSMVNFIKPLFLGTEKEFANLYANPIKNGQHKDSNKRDIKVMKQRSFVLHKKLSKFVQRKEAELLKSFLPKKFEYVLFIPMTSVQNKLYERILETINSRQDHRGRSLITDYTCLRKIWTHPKVLEDAWKNAINQQYKRDAKKPPNSDDDQPDDIYDSQTGFMSVKNDWWRNLIAERDLESILPSNKLRTMFEILRMCEENGDKCLIFSAFVAVLNVVEYFFKKLAAGEKEIFSELNISQGIRSTWESNKDYFRLDGKTSKSTRHEMIKRFNHPQNTRARVFLISAKAGGQGINLIGANRVIILDTSWNPSNDQQNIFRIFRLGQKKNCYIYRLLALGTMEEKVYSRSVTKQAMSFRVMDVQQIDRHYSMAELAELYTLTIPNYSERPTPIFPQDSILANLLRSFPDLVYKYHEHDSLLENQVEQELSEQEKIDAWNAYENDLQMNSQIANMEEMQNKMAQGNMPNYMGPGGGTIPPGINLQFMNFRNMNTRDNAGFMNPSMLQYNYANQQYLDFMNKYRQYSTAEGAAALNAVAAAYSSMNPGMYPSVPPVSVSPHLTTNPNSTAHPLSALSDLSMYGLGMNGPSTSAAAAAAAAAAAQLSQLPSPSPNNASSLYATPNMQTQSAANASNLYTNQIYQTLQQLAYGGAGTPSSGSLLNNPAHNSYANSVPFPAPRLTPPQSAARKSSTPDLTTYRTSGGSISMPALTPPAPPLPSPSLPASSLSAQTLSNQLTDSKKSGSSQNNSNKNMPNNSNNNVKNKSNTEATNLSFKGTDLSSRKAANKPTKTTTTTTTTTTSNAVRNHSNMTSTIRTDINNTLQSSQNRQITSTTAATNLTTNNVLTTTSKDSLPKAKAKPAASTSSSSTLPTTTKPADPQIRVKDMTQLCATTNSHAANLQAAAAAAARDVRNTFSNVSTTSSGGIGNSSVAAQNKQSAIDNRLLTATTSAKAAEFLKARSEMQIIPTTSPPGTASISKQLSEISPSISLTALRTTNVKTSSASSGSNMPKVSAANTNMATGNNKTSRMKSPATITTSVLSNRQQTASPTVQQRKTVTNPISTTSYSGANLSNLSNNGKKSAPPTVATTVTTSMPNLQQARKVATPTPQSMVAMSVSSIASNKNSNITNKTTITSSANSITNNAKYNASSVQASVTTVTPTATIATSSSKGVPNILRGHHIRKIPSPLPTTSTSTSGNMNITVKDSGSSNQSHTNGNARSPLVVNTKVGTAKTSVANAAQLIYNSKNSSTVRRSFSPTTTSTIQSQNTSRTASPAHVSSSTSIEKILPSSGINTSTVRKLNTKTPTPTPTPPPTSLPSATSAFPVHLQRNNSSLGTMRTVSPLSPVKPGVSGPGNRSNTAIGIVTPKIAKVTSLNTSTAGLSLSTASATSTPTLTTATTAARVTAFKKTSSIGVKLGPPTAKQLQTMVMSAVKVAAASSVAQQKRPLPSTISGSAAPAQQLNQQTSKQRTNAQPNGRGLSISTAPSRILLGDTQIGGVSVRPILKTGSAATGNGGSQSIGDKRNIVSPHTTSASGQAAAKLLLDRKRKASELLNKEGSLNKRPKES